MPAPAPERQGIGPGPDDFTIEGYGTDLAKPLETRTVTLHPGGATNAR